MLIYFFEGGGGGGSPLNWTFLVGVPDMTGILFLFGN